MAQLVTSVDHFCRDRDPNTKSACYQLVESCIVVFLSQSPWDHGLFWLRSESERRVDVRSLGRVRPCAHLSAPACPSRRVNASLGLARRKLGKRFPPFYRVPADQPASSENKATESGSPRSPRYLPTPHAASSCSPARSQMVLGSGFRPYWRISEPSRSGGALFAEGSVTHR